MHILSALLAFVASAASSSEPGKPITVTGHSWAPFISPMGEPFRAHSASDDTLAAWFRQADLDHDGRLTEDEMVADADRFFAKLDANRDGEIDPDELNQYEWDLAPEIQLSARTRRAPGLPVARSRATAEDMAAPGRRHEGEDEDSSLGLHGALQGGARYGLLNIPEPVASADTDFNRAITIEEFRRAARERFALLDRAHAGAITLMQLEIVRQGLLDDAKARRGDRRAPDTRVGNSVPRDF